MFGYFEKMSPEETLDFLLSRSEEPKMDCKDVGNSQLFFVRVLPAENKSFVRNDGGWIRNDIDLLMNLEDKALASDILGKLQEFNQRGFESGVDPEVIRMGMQSKYQQTQAEVTSWLEDQIDRKMIEDERLALEQDEKLSVEERKTRLAKFKESLNSEERDIWLSDKRAKLRSKMIDEDEELNNG